MQTVETTSDIKNTNQPRTNLVRPEKSGLSLLGQRIMALRMIWIRAPDVPDKTGIGRNETMESVCKQN